MNYLLNIPKTIYNNIQVNKNIYLHKLKITFKEYTYIFYVLTKKKKNKMYFKQNILFVNKTF